MLESLARMAVRGRWLVLAAWAVLVVLGGLLGPLVFERLDAGMGTRDDVESAEVERLLAEVGGVGTDLFVLLDDAPVADPELAAEVTALASRLRGLPEVRAVVDPGAAPVTAGLVAEDGRAQLLAIEWDPTLEAADIDRVVDEATALAERLDVPRVVVGGPGALEREFQVASETQLVRGELIALPFVALLLLVAFRGVLPALVPLLVAPGAVLGALLVLLGVGHATTLSTYAVNVVTMVGLGLSIDYALLIVHRFREERAADGELVDAIGRTMATAGRTVVFSGVTVIVALGGLLVFAEPLLRSMAWGAIGVVLLTVAGAVTLVPALLGLWGRRIRPRAPREGRGGFFRLARVVQRYAWVVAPVLIVGLVAVAAPVRDAEWGGSGPESLPAASPTRQLAESVAERFPGGGSQPVVVVADPAAGSPAAAPLVRAIEALPGVAAVRPRPDAPAGMTVVDVLPDGPSQGAVAKQLVRDLRALTDPVPVRVGGPAAALIDFQDSVRARLPWALALIGLATFVLLFLLTGSVVAPLKAIIMNVLSLGASFGALVWIFQQGHLAGLLGVEPGPIDSTVPLLIFVFAFGLSMDYEVFLLARIKEDYDRTRDNDHAVAAGLQRTGRVVTLAAALMVAVFLGFAAGDVLTVTQLGVAMAVTILVDATIVRCLLVPAVMRLMGHRNWWAPGFLRAIHAKLTLREPAPAATPAVERV